MKLRHLFAFALLTLPTTQAWADTPVTSTDVPPPGPAQARLWLEAVVQAPLLELCGPSLSRSEPARMYLAVQRDHKLGPGVGWYDPSQRRWDWTWLATRFDANRDDRIMSDEFAGSPEWFKRLDRDGDRAVTADDLDWSQRSEWVRRDERAFRLLRSMDGDGNGRVTEEEWLGFFRRAAEERTFLNAEDFREMFSVERGDQGKAKKVSKDVWLRSLMAGDLGSPFEGPRVGQTAPDFCLPTHDGKQQIVLSKFRGRKPVALIFGSFT